MALRKKRNTARLMGLLLLFISREAYCHQHIDPARARLNDDIENVPGEGIKVDRPGTTGIPCGSPAGTVPAANNFVAGQTATFRVYATIAHPGYEFASVYHGNNPQLDSDFTPLPLVSAVYTNENGVKTNETIDNTAQFISAKLNRTQAGFVDLDMACANPNDCYIDVTVTIPANTVCNPSCTIQWVEEMEDNPAVPDFYKSCMDVAVSGGTGPTPTPDPSPTPTPTPIASPPPSSGGSSTGNGNCP